MLTIVNDYNIYKTIDIYDYNIYIYIKLGENNYMYMYVYICRLSTKRIG